VEEREKGNKLIGLFEVPAEGNKREEVKQNKLNRRNNII
jgi:hypothetical protein